MRRKPPMARPVRILASFVAGVLLFALLGGANTFGAQVQYWRVEQGMAQPSLAKSLKDVPLGELTGIVLGAVFAGFRSQAANFCWWKSQQYWEQEGHWPRVLPMMKAACALDPYFPEFWEMTGWHEAYNLAAEYEIRDLPIDRYVHMGLKTLHTGLRYNPHAVQLYEQVAWTHRDKYGELHDAIKYSRQALAAWHVRAQVTKQTPSIQPRYVAHQWEDLGRPDNALLQYAELFYDYPEDTVCIGASLTIRDRYLPAWLAVKRGELDRAIELVTLHLKDDPADSIGLHMLANLLHDKNDVWGELAAWEAGATEWNNVYAQRKYNEMLKQTGRAEKQLTYIPMQNLLNAKRVADYLVQPKRTRDDRTTPRGMGVTLRYRPAGAPPGSETVLSVDEPIAEGDTLVASPWWNELEGVRCEAVFYFHGREVGRDSTAPYTFTIPEGLLPPPHAAPAAGTYLKVELHVPGEPLPRFDMREVKLASERLRGHAEPGREAPMPMGPGPAIPATGPGMMGGPGPDHVH